MNGCQIITTKRGNSSNSLDFKEVYSLYRFTENIWIDYFYKNQNKLLTSPPALKIHNE